MMFFWTAFFWIATPLVALVVCAAQRPGKDYFPANLILGLAVASRPAFYLSIFAVLRDAEQTVAWSLATNAANWSYLAQTGLLGWAGYLVIRTNLAKPGSSMSLGGHAARPNAAQIREALIVVARADFHDLMNAEQRRLAEEYRLTAAGRRAAQARVQADFAEAQRRVAEERDA